MNATVIVFMPGRDSQSLTEQASVLPVVDTLPPQSAESDNTGADLRQTSSRDQATPPFWTWFIENPRRCGARG